MLTRENLKAAGAKFSTLSYPVSVMIVIMGYRREWPHLELKIQPRFNPISLSLSITSTYLG